MNYSVFNFINSKKEVSARLDTTTGFTLVETMVALIILSVMLGGAFQAISIGARSISNANTKNQILALAEELISSANTNTLLTSKGEGKNDLTWRVIKHDTAANRLQLTKIEIRTLSNSTIYSFYAFESER